MKRSPLNSRSQSRRSVLERKADALIQEACRLMYRGRCLRCKREGHAGHHIVSRDNKDLRHKIMNVVYVCDPCHRFAESNEAEFLEFLRMRWPAIYAWNREHKNDPAGSITCVTLQDNIDALRQLITRLEDERVK